MATLPSTHVQPLPLRGSIIKTSTAHLRRYTAVLVVWVVALAALGVTGRAVAAPSTPPYVNAPGQNITLSRTVVNAGGGATVAAIGAVPGHNINFYIHSAEVYLGTFRANSSGVASGPITVPAGFTGRHTIVARDPLNGQTWNTSLTIVSAAAAGSSSSSGSGTTGGLPNTGAAVMGLGVLVLILLTGGATLLLLGRRRVRSSH
jgi:hypothetical protein